MNENYLPPEAALEADMAAAWQEWQDRAPPQLKAKLSWGLLKICHVVFQEGYLACLEKAARAMEAANGS